MINLLLGNAACLAIIGGTILLNGHDVSAHGYVKSPISRAYQGELDKEWNVLGYEAAFEKYGNAINNKKALEWYKGFPEKGPVDGHIASAEGAINNQIGDFKLDFQAANFWKTQKLKGGPNQFTWEYTAAHNTENWEYYITKKGWDPNAPLTRNEFEKLTTIEQPGNKPADTYPTHTVNLPTDRSGYYVVLAVWNSTENAFYQVIDVDLENDGNSSDEDHEKPDKVTGIKAKNITTNSADISWNESHDNKGVTEYQIYRDNKLVGTSNKTTFHDTGLKENTSYVYTITAKDANENYSEKSDAFKITTNKAPENDTERPSAPTHLHSMGNTSSSIDLMWGASSDNVGVEKYAIYRNGKMIAETEDARFKDTNLVADTYYVYYVVALDASNNMSGSTNILIEKTKAASSDPTYPEWEATKVYKGGDNVSYNGKHYQAKWEQSGLVPGADQWGPWKLLED